MATNKDYKKEWFEKSQLDYFSAFITLWLSCNSWYNFHYSETTDRENINAIKNDTSSKNKLYDEFKKIFNQPNTKEQKSFFSNIEQLYYSLNRSRIQPDKLLFQLSLENALIDFSNRGKSEAYESLIIKNAKTRTGKLKNTVSGFDLGDIVLINDTQKIFAGCFEIIYQIRCQLVHGNLDPTEENMDTVRYCYLILFDLLKPFCS